MWGWRANLGLWSEIGLGLGVGSIIHLCISKLITLNLGFLISKMEVLVIELVVLDLSTKSEVL